MPGRIRIDQQTGDAADFFLLFKTCLLVSPFGFQAPVHVQVRLRFSKLLTQPILPLFKHVNLLTSQGFRVFLLFPKKGIFQRQFSALLLLLLPESKVLRFELGSLLLLVLQHTHNIVELGARLAHLLFIGLQFFSFGLKLFMPVLCLSFSKQGLYIGICHCFLPPVCQAALLASAFVPLAVSAIIP